jgi:hypothetical protein
MVLELHNRDEHEDQFLALAAKRANRLEAAIGALDSDIEELQSRREVLHEELGLLHALLGRKRRPEEPPTSVPRATAPGGTDADKVVSLLANMGKPMHYREIERELRARGQVTIGGQDPANTLLARYFDDERLYRSSRGTYALREWNRTARSVGTRRVRKSRGA